MVLTFAHFVSLFFRVSTNVLELCYIFQCFNLLLKHCEDRIEYDDSVYRNFTNSYSSINFIALLFIYVDNKIALSSYVELIIGLTARTFMLVYFQNFRYCINKFSEIKF